MNEREMSAYEFCQMVVQHVKEEPRRLHMSYWKLSPEHRVFKALNPPCHTVCCTAGWIATLAGRRADEDADFTAIELLARSLVGVDRDECIDRLAVCFYEYPRLEAGTEEYVNAAMKPFEQWMELYKPQLEAHTLTIPDRE